MEIKISSSYKTEYYKNLPAGAIFARNATAEPCIKTDESNYVYLSNGDEIYIDKDGDFYKEGRVIVFSKSKLLLEY